MFVLWNAQQFPHHAITKYLATRVRILNSQGIISAKGITYKVAIDHFLPILIFLAKNFMLSVVIYLVLCTIDIVFWQAIFGLRCLPSFAEYPLHMQEKLAKVAWYEV